MTGCISSCMWCVISLADQYILCDHSRLTSTILSIHLLCSCNYSTAMNTCFISAKYYTLIMAALLFKLLLIGITHLISINKILHNLECLQMYTPCSFPVKHLIHNVLVNFAALTYMSHNLLLRLRRYMYTK
jgi:hypothetical protein